MAECVIEGRRRACALAVNKPRDRLVLYNHVMAVLVFENEDCARVVSKIFFRSFLCHFAIVKYEFVMHFIVILNLIILNYAMY